MICFRRGATASAFLVRQALREDAAATVAALQRAGYRVLILSGDRPAAVADAAEALGVAEWEAGLTPAEKIARIEALKAEGRQGADGRRRDQRAPALAAAHVSISPVTAAHVSQAAADAVFIGGRLAPVLSALATGRKAKRLMPRTSPFRRSTTSSRFPSPPPASSPR